MNNVIAHQRITLQSNYVQFTEKLESCLGRFDSTILSQVNEDPEGVRAAIKKMEGYEDFMLFDIIDHGTVLKLENKMTGAKRYLIGNPLVAMTMTKLDVRAGMYVPVNVFVYVTLDGNVCLEYDLPSSLMEQLDNEAITEVALHLDQDLLKLFEYADQA